MGEYDNPAPTINSNDLEEDLKFIARMIIGVKYIDYRPEWQVRNCFIELLNGSIDVDKLDYIVRDTKMSGISNTSLDIERLLGSLIIVPTTVYSNKIFDESSPIFTDHIIRKLKISNGQEVSLLGNIDRDIKIQNGEISIPVGAKISLRKVDDTTKNLHYSAAAFATESGVWVDSKRQPVSSHIVGITVEDSAQNGFDLKLESASVLGPPITKTNNFDFNVDSRSEYLLRIHQSPGSLGIKLNADVTIDSPTRFSGKLFGKIDYLEILCDVLEETESPPSEICYTGFNLGFGKQAINLIFNVFGARNYLYLWIYSHHKVVYYANYLIIELARLSDSEYEFNTAPFMEFMTNLITDNSRSYLLDEDFMLARIRQAFANKHNSEFASLFDQMITRKYRRSLYKSLAEFDLTFAFSDDDIAKKKKMREHLNVITDISNTTNQSGQEYGLKYGKIKPEVLAEMTYQSKPLCDFVEDVLWVESQPSLKGAKSSEILIDFKNNLHVTTMDRISIINTNAYSSNQDYYFYLYFMPSTSLHKDENGKEIDVKVAIKVAFFEYMKTKLL